MLRFSTHFSFSVLLCKLVADPFHLEDCGEDAEHQVGRRRKTRQHLPIVVRCRTKECGAKSWRTSEGWSERLMKFCALAYVMVRITRASAMPPSS
ncbi:hypothetical protein EDD36DRAFT_428536 [Exophiala viscosa]|uniref:Secreted protein n=1 Tax=Exophiala viscosa TaxID=2486360 RepID=A0AAN6IFZ9_9EURO|nr:hypothetical protein EDD36DRAFT_428536 [Exophiala viscosa]